MWEPSYQGDVGGQVAAIDLNRHRTDHLLPQLKRRAHVGGIVRWRFGEPPLPQKRE